MQIAQIRLLTKSRQRLLILFLALLLVVLIAASLLIPYEAITGIINEIIAGIVTSGIVLAFFHIFLPESRRLEDIVAVDPRDITAEFHDALTAARRWYFKGNFGRYLRTKVLESFSNKSNVDIDASIIDPRDRSLCEQHAVYRSEIYAIDKGISYDWKEVASQALATITVCAWYHNNKRISIDLYLSRIFDPVRIDASDDVMFITVEDRRSPALKIEGRHFMFSHFMDHMRYFWGQGCKIDIAGFPTRKNLAQITEDDISCFFKQKDMDVICNKVGARKVMEIVHKNENPYSDQLNL